MDCLTYNLQCFFSDLTYFFSFSVKYKIYQPRTEITTLSGIEIKTIEKCECPPTAFGDHCEVCMPVSISY